MKKKQCVLTFTIVVLVGMLCGCGINKAISKDEIITTEETVLGDTNTNETEELQSTDNNEKIKAKLISEEKQKADVPMVELPEGIEGMKAETEAYPDLEKLIAEYYEIPDDYFDLTSYYYNYVDLNNDGSNEIFVVVNGPYTSGTGGSSALWIVENGGQLHVNQDFTLVNTPVIISDKITNGVHELVIPYSGGGAESQYKILTCSDGFYSPINDADSVKTLEGITGKAIIANDLLNEFTNGIEGLRLKVK